MPAGKSEGSNRRISQKNDKLGIFGLIPLDDVKTGRCVGGPYDGKMMEICQPAMTHFYDQNGYAGHYEHVPTNVRGINGQALYEWHWIDATGQH